MFLFARSVVRAMRRKSKRLLLTERVRCDVSSFAPLISTRYNMGQLCIVSENLNVIFIVQISNYVPT